MQNRVEKTNEAIPLFFHFAFNVAAVPLFLTIRARDPSLTNPTIFSLRSLSSFTGRTKCEKNSSGPLVTVLPLIESCH
jgi:hypothetical protein